MTRDSDGGILFSQGAEHLMPVYRHSAACRASGRSTPEEHPGTQLQGLAIVNTCLLYLLYFTN